MFYEHVSRQSTVDTSKHRRGRHLLLQQMYFSLHHMSSHAVDFCPGRYTIASPRLLHFTSSSSLLSLPRRTRTLRTADTPLHSRTNFRPFAGSREAPAPRGAGEALERSQHLGLLGQGGASYSENTPRRSMYTRRFLSYACKTNSCFQEGNFLSSYTTNINVLTLKALPHLPVWFCFSFFKVWGESQC